MWLDFRTIACQNGYEALRTAIVYKWMIRILHVNTEHHMLHSDWSVWHHDNAACRCLCKVLSAWSQSHFALVKLHEAVIQRLNLLKPDMMTEFSMHVFRNTTNKRPKTCTTVNSFKSHLDRIRHNQMDFFMDLQSVTSYGCLMRNDLPSAPVVQLHQVRYRCVSE